MISGLYRDTFDGVVAGAVDLNWSKLGWNFPLQKLVPVLMATRTLEKLDLSDNQLTGTIPAELGQLTQLKKLYLDNNQLTGAIPRELGQLTQLTMLHVHENQLTGAIPRELGQLTQLTELHLAYNQLTGAIPRELGQLTQLKELDLCYNQLERPPGCPRSDMIYRGAEVTAFLRCLS